MLKRYHHIISGVFRITDALVIGIAWMAAYGFRFHVPLLQVKKGLPTFQTYIALSPLIISVWITVFSVMQVYPSQRILRRTHEVQLLCKAHGVALLFFIALTYLFSEYKYSRAVVLSFGILSLVLLILFRIMLRNGLRFIRQKGYNLKHVLLIGEGKAIETLIQSIHQFPELGLRILGIVTHNQSPISKIQGQSVIGHFSQLKILIEQLHPDQIILSLPRNQYEDMEQILTFIQEDGMSIHLIPDIHEYITLGCKVEDFDGLPIVNLNDSPLSGWGGIGKRLTDLLLSSIALLILSPLFFVIGIAIKLTSSGRIFYAQERMGLDGNTFQMLKFRSMHSQAEAHTGAIWASTSDSRRTALGVILRKTSLDELPQLWNVFKGEMSLVGPRPERPIFVKKFRQEIPYYMLRHKVKAGMTGWAQIHGWRGNTSLEKRIEFDLYYIRHWTYFLDLKILILTLWKGFMDKNAY